MRSKKQRRQPSFCIFAFSWARLPNAMALLQLAVSLANESLVTGGPKALAEYAARSGLISLLSKRGLHSTSTASSPQYGGYMRTGTGTGEEVSHESPRFFVTGSCGQIGQEFLPFLRSKLGSENVIASDVRTSRRMLDAGPFSYCDVLDKDNMARIILENGITHVVHLATLLSAIGERNPALALKVNTQGIQNVLELAAAHDLAVYAPSTIAVFGSSTPRHNTPDDTIMRPTTMYGITKVHQELLGQYYADRYHVDYRSLRYPGIISANSPPGGGTTDYAVEIFCQALKTNHYNCFLASDAALPMMYMPDCLEATWRLITAPKESLLQTTYNVTATTFTPAELAEAIRHRLPEFTISYTPDFRDAIAKTWPASIDDSAARQQWGWQPKYDLQAMTDDMLKKLAPRFGVQLPAELQEEPSSSGTKAATSSSSTTTGSASKGSTRSSTASVFFPGDFKMDAGAAARV